jgi:hypothetical protein
MRTLIHRLAKPMLGLFGRDDRGAIGVLVGVLMGGGVLLGIGALVVDVGQLYQERAELQNGADAGALATARTCVVPVNCDPARADRYANWNAKDGVSAVDLVCGRDDRGVLPSCPGSTGSVTDCSAAPASGINYVDVHTSTRTKDGSTLLPPMFARALLGNSAYPGSTVRACARALWGPPTPTTTTPITTLALTISQCEWWVATGGTPSGPASNPVYAPPYAPNPDKSFDQVLRLHGKTTGTCPGGPAGSDGPGMFGWVYDATGDCSAVISGSTYSSKPGVAAGHACQQKLDDSWRNKTMVFIPVYGSVSGNGANGTYTLAGFAAFVVTGYHVPGFTASDWLDSTQDCNGPDMCVNGFFTQAPMPCIGTVGGGQGMGAVAIQIDE